MSLFLDNKIMLIHAAEKMHRMGIKYPVQLGFRARMGKKCSFIKNLRSKIEPQEGK
jgi:hypothetical protein